jgi:hypothetical protein
MTTPQEFARYRAKLHAEIDGGSCPRAMAAAAPSP